MAFVSSLTLTHEVLAVFVAEFRIFGVILFPVNIKSLDCNTRTVYVMIANKNNKYKKYLNYLELNKK